MTRLFVIRDFMHLLDDIDVSTIDANGAAAGSAKFTFLAAKGAALAGVEGQPLPPKRSRRKSGDLDGSCERAPPDPCYSDLRT